MSFETDLWDALTGNTELAALISKRLYRSRAEEDPVTPYVRMYQVRNHPSQGYDGAVLVERPVLVFQVFANTDDETISVCSAMRAAFVTLNYPVFIEDEISTSEAISGLRRRDMTVRMAHG